MPGGVSLAQRREAINWRFSTEPQAQLDGRRIALPRGRGLGGSALINGMVYFRGHPRDYDDWAAAGATGWSFAEVLPYFLRSEDNADFGPDVWHAKGGPMHVRTVTHPNPLNQVFFEAMASLGHGACRDFNGADSEGTGLRQLSVRAGRRETTARAMLRPALGRPNLRVVTGVRATRVLLQAGRAVGLEGLHDGQRREWRAGREVVLCAGALQSPQLLLLSGIGDPLHLADVGIPVQHALRGVGRNLHDHLASPVHMGTRDTTPYGLSWRALPRGLWTVLQYALARRGPLANNFFEAAAFVKTDAGLDRPDLQFVFQAARRPPPGFAFPVGHGYAISPVGLYPRSRGRLLLASADPLAAPRVDPALLSDPADLAPLLHGLRLARRVFAAPAFARFGATEVSPGPGVQDDAALTAYIRAASYTVHHPVSTCRMGVDDEAVVDARLRVHGLAGLRVADASVFPSIIGGNTNAAVVMVAEKAADLLLDRTPPPPARIPA
jgi:choline dehydrogenase-like flavoprotein